MSKPPSTRCCHFRNNRSPFGLPVACIDPGGSLCWLIGARVEGLAHQAGYGFVPVSLNLPRRVIPPPALVTLPSIAPLSKKIIFMPEGPKLEHLKQQLVAITLRYVTIDSYPAWALHNSQVLSAIQWKKGPKGAIIPFQKVHKIISDQDLASSRSVFCAEPCAAG